MAKVCRHCFVTGHVQGVFYRANTKEKAESLGIKGWVRNLSDGRVEVFFCGDKDSVVELESWLNVGPDAATVDNVESNVAKYQDFTDFKVI